MVSMFNKLRISNIFSEFQTER